MIHSNNLFGLQIWHLQDDDDNDKNNPDEDKQSKGQYAKIKKKKEIKPKKKKGTAAIKPLDLPISNNPKNVLMNDMNTPYKQTALFGQKLSFMSKTTIHSDCLFYRH